MTRRSALGMALAMPALVSRAAFAEVLPRMPIAGRGLTLTFADEFDDTDVRRINENAVSGRPNAPAWRSRYRHPRKDVINKEKQIYMDRAFAGSGREPLGVDPFSIRDGVLTIEADRADPERVAPFLFGQRFTSGCISSELTFRQRYGIFEVCARMPKGRGFWPAAWLLPASGRWPPEIDIVEASGAKPRSYHHGVIKPKRGMTTGASGPPGQGGLTGRWFDERLDTTDGFHTYGVDWDPEVIRFFVDGEETFAVRDHGVHEEMYLLINLALGSHDPKWIPDPDETTPFPGRLAIDYVRCWSSA